VPGGQLGRERMLLRVDGRLCAVRAVVFRRSIAASDAKGIISLSLLTRTVYAVTGWRSRSRPSRRLEREGS
jgi:hypothetical protein